MARLSLRDRAYLIGRALAGTFDIDPGSVGGQMLARIYPASATDPPKRGTLQFLEAYSTSPWLRAVEGRIASAVAATSWRLYAVKRAKAARAMRDTLIQRSLSHSARKSLLAEREAAGELQLIPEHLFLTALDTGNAYMTGLGLRKITQIHLDCVGEAYWLKERNRLGTPIAFWPLPPNWVLNTPTMTHPFYRVSYRGWQAEIPQAEMLWMVDPDPVNPYGRGSGPVMAVGDELDTDEFMAKTVRQRFFNQARPDFIVMPTGSETLAPADVKRLEQQWLQQHQGFWRAFKPLFASREVKIHEFQQDFSKLQLADMRKHERDMIIQVTGGIPPELLGIVENCHDEDTECLTKRGWLRHTDLSLNDEIGTWADGVFAWQRPSELHAFDHDGPMHRWQNGRIDIMTTGGHRLWVSGHHKGAPFHFETADQAAHRAAMKWRITGGASCEGARTTVEIPHEPYGRTGKKGTDSGFSIPVETFASFLGAWITEGWLTSNAAGQSFSVAYAQSEGAKADVMVASMRAIGVGEVRVYRREAQVVNGAPYGQPMIQATVASKSLWTWLFAHVGKGAANKRLPQEVFDWPETAQRSLLQAIKDGDGWTFNEHGTFGIASISERLIDDLQRLGVMLGYRVSRGVKTAATSANQLLHQAIFSHRTEAYVRQSAHSVSHYVGRVWCVTVPAGLFFTRRNYKVALHGNSNRSTIDAAKYLMDTQVVVPRLEFQRAIFQERLITEYDDRLIVDYVSPVSEDVAQQLAAMTAAPWAATVDEWRHVQGLAAKADGSGTVHMVPMTLTPVETLTPEQEERDVDTGREELIPAPKLYDPPRAPPVGRSRF